VERVKSQTKEKDPPSLLELPPSLFELWRDKLAWQARTKWKAGVKVRQ
jgi:hypothetical protein